MKPYQHQGKQSGFVLVTAVMFLVVLTILALSIMGTGTLEERMAGYARDRQLAFQSAEAALREAERDILYGNRGIIGEMGFVDGCSDDGLCKPKKTGRPIWGDLEISTNPGYAAWMKGDNTNAVKSTKYGTFSAPPSPILNDVAAQPRYIIEVLKVMSSGTSLVGGTGPASSTIVYRVTAVGFGRQVTTRVVLQGLYRP